MLARCRAIGLVVVAMMMASGCHLHLHLNDKHYHTNGAATVEQPGPDVVLEVEE